MERRFRVIHTGGGWWRSIDVRNYCSPSKHAGSDPEAFWLPVVVITASVQPKSARIVYARSDFPHPFQFCFSKEGMDHIAQNRPGSDLDGLVRVWPNASGLEASRCARIIRPGSGRTQPARYQFSTFRLGSVLPQTSRIILCTNCTFQ